MPRINDPPIDPPPSGGGGGNPPANPPPHIITTYDLGSVDPGGAGISFPSLSQPARDHRWEPQEHVEAPQTTPRKARNAHSHI